MESTSKREIWNTLSNTDCSAHIITDDDGVQIIQVMAAHALMMSAYPEYTYKFLPDSQGRELHYLDDGSAEVRLTMTVEGHEKTVSLPIHRNTQSIKNPSSWDLNTAKQRLRVRAMGEFGLAHQLWIKDQAAPEPEYLEDAVADAVADDSTMADEYWVEADLDCGKSTSPETKEGRKRCGIAKTVRGGETRAIRAARPAKMAELKVLEKIIEKW